MAFVRTESEVTAGKGQTSLTENEQSVEVEASSSVTDSGRNDSGIVSEAMVMNIVFTLRFSDDSPIDPDLYGTGPTDGC